MPPGGTGPLREAACAAYTNADGPIPLTPWPSAAPILWPAWPCAQAPTVLPSELPCCSQNFPAAHTDAVHVRLCREQSIPAGATSPALSSG